jgi:hypothetical protein
MSHLGMLSLMSEIENINTGPKTIEKVNHNHLFVKILFLVLAKE